MIPQLINRRKPTTDEFGIEEVEMYSVYINQDIEKKKKGITIKKKVPRKYIFEIHKFDGFAMIKFYPRCKVRDDKKYILRGNDLGFNLNKKNFTILINAAI